MDRIRQHRWQTKVSVKRASIDFSYASSIFSIGSCFAVNVSECLKRLKFSVASNPFGIMYNPVSIFKNLQILVGKRHWTDQQAFENQGRWRDYMFHSDLSASTSSGFSEKARELIDNYSGIVASSDFFIITLGTAYGWKLIETGEIVSNCHKMPGHLFERVLLSRETILKSLQGIRQIVQEINPKAGILFSVSPVRHIRDGLVNNSRSKARLIDCVHELVNNERAQVAYFPAYEIVMDELRDYRFYADDMLHPSKQAVSYVSDIFLDTYLRENDRDVLMGIDHIQKNLAHRASDTKSQAYKSHLTKTLEQIKAIQLKFPRLDFSSETILIQEQLEQ